MEIATPDSSLWRVNVLAHTLFGIAVQLAAQEVWVRPRRERNSRIG